MKALLALRSVGFCVGQRQMCLNVRWVSFFFVFMQQKYLCHSVVCFVFFTMNGNGCVYETFGISKRFPVKLQLLLIRAETLDKPLTAKCFIHVVRAMCIIFLEVFKYKFHYFVFTQTDFFLIPNFRFRSHILNFSLLSKMII